MISFISLFEIINVVVPNPNIFLWIAALVADTAVVDPNVIKTILAYGLSTFFNKANLFFNNGPKILLKNPLYCPILCNSVFNNL